MVLTIVAVGISVLWTLGLFSLMGYSYNVLASMLVPLIVVLAIADDVHIMQHWDEERRHKSAEASFKATVAHLATPLFGASATTALGMASLATSHVVAVRSFGVGSAVGIMVDFMISLVFVPTLLSLMKPETEGAAAREIPGRSRCGGSRAFSTRTSAAGAGRHGGARSGRPVWASATCASTPTTSTSSAPITRSGSRPG